MILHSRRGKYSNLRFTTLLIIISCLLIQWLKDEERSIRQLATEELGEIKDARAVEPLIAELNDVNGGVRRKAAKALEDME